MLSVTVWCSTSLRFPTMSVWNNQPTTKIIVALPSELSHSDTVIILRCLYHSREHRILFKMVQKRSTSGCWSSLKQFEVTTTTAPHSEKLAEFWSWWLATSRCLFKTHFNWHVCPVQTDVTRWLSQLFSYFIGIQTKWFYRQCGGRKLVSCRQRIALGIHWDIYKHFSV